MANEIAALERLSEPAQEVLARAREESISYRQRMVGTEHLLLALLHQRGSITAGDVVVVSALTFRILHGSRDLAMALVDMTQHFSYLGETLRIIGRHHTVEQVREVYRMAREVGFDNINMDLILGLPNESVEDVRRTMEEIEKMAPDNVTIHSLALKRAARLNLERDRYRNLSFENSWERMDIASESCARMGLEPYYLYRQKNMAGNFENTGFAAPGKAGIYNILIMEEKQSIVALGAGATTKAVFPGGRIERVENVKDVESYIARIDEVIERKHQLFQL